MRVHEHTEGWETGCWDEDDEIQNQDETIETSSGKCVVEKRRRFSLLTMSSCCGQIEDIDERKGGFLPYKLSRRRSSQRPRLEIECTLKDDVQNDYKKTEDLIDAVVPIEPLDRSLIDQSFSISPTHRRGAMPPPSEWKYAPLLLVPTPGSGTIIQRIRQADDLDGSVDYNPSSVHLPINNGKEMAGWVIDFTTPNFQGTALFRIRNSLGTEQQEGSTSKSSTDYFANYNRKFQMVIRGKFLHPVKMADCMSGLMLDRPLRTAGSVADPLLACAEIDTPEIVATPTPINRKKNRRTKKQESLPPKWVLRASVKIAGLFSPRMDADLECVRPRILTPLCSVAQSVQVAKDGEESSDLMTAHAEPHHRSKQSLVNELKQYQETMHDNTSSVQIRKKTFDSIYDARLSHPDQPTPHFDTNATYTFEFLQHLIDYNDFSLDFGTIVGKMKLGGALKGQPCRFVAGIVNRENNEEEGCAVLDGGCLWSFDLWHESLLVNR